MRGTRAEIFIMTGLASWMNFYLNFTFFLFVLFFFSRVYKISYSLRKFTYFKLTETRNGVFHALRFCQNLSAHVRDLLMTNQCFSVAVFVNLYHVLKDRKRTLFKHQPILLLVLYCFHPLQIYKKIQRQSYYDFSIRFSLFSNN